MGVLQAPKATARPVSMPRAGRLLYRPMTRKNMPPNRRRDQSFSAGIFGRTIAPSR
jgi:hypothetical protein